jgi:hypothetical protein
MANGKMGRGWVGVWGGGGGGGVGGERMGDSGEGRSPSSLQLASRFCTDATHCAVVLVMTKQGADIEKALVRLLFLGYLSFDHGVIMLAPRCCLPPVHIDAFWHALPYLAH